MTDSQKSRVYAAEQTLRHVLVRDGEVEMFGRRMTVPMERKFASIESIQAFCDYVLDHHTVLEHFGPRGYVSVKPRRGRTQAHYQMGEIHVPEHLEGGRTSWAMREIVVLHELAHHMTRGHGHDEQFCRAFVKLVELVMSPECGWLLWVLMCEEGCKVAR